MFFLCFVYIQNNTRLRVLVLKSNNFTCHGAKYLGELLKLNNFIEELDISSNGIEDEGIMDLCQGIRINSPVIRLSFANCNLKEKGIICLLTHLQMVRALRSLNISRTLIMGDTNETTKSLAHFVQKNTELKCLNLSFSNLRDFDINYLVRYGFSNESKIESLDLQANKITDVSGTLPH